MAASETTTDDAPERTITVGATERCDLQVGPEHADTLADIAVECASEHWDDD